MDVELWDSLIATYAGLAELQARTSDLFADVLDSYTEASAGNQVRLAAVARFRTQATTLMGLTEDALADLQGTIEMLEPPHGEDGMAGKDRDTRLAREIANGELAHCAEQFATVAALVRQGESSQEQLRTASRRLQLAAVAWRQAHGHADVP